MFGFGKALDVMRDGDAVSRDEWRPEIWGDAPRLVLVAKELRESGFYMATSGVGGQVVRSAQFVIVTGIFEDNDLYERPWFPTHEDLLAEDWDYVR